ncbi:hypothetical protein Deima_2668 [Deinococcus maricopensis DSM 21211]|uniref:Uncharacterized protein n=2 Tax=Deinococcus TaxID=1298 RepID=E8UB62_DEIML|nr:hypothetical protein Deima_2668 [Deinococcus maricopensis DSM 21211]
MGTLALPPAVAASAVMLIAWALPFHPHWADPPWTLVPRALTLGAHRAAQWAAR